MRCPYCNAPESKVIDSRPTEEGSSIRRRRECMNCQRRFTTYEIVESLPIIVVKRDGTHQSFDRNKIINAMVRAFDKRKVTMEDLERNLRIIAANKIVCIENTVDGKYDAIYGISIRAPGMNHCAIGLHVRQDTPPAEEERSRFREVLLSGTKEINRRLRFEEELL